MTNIEITHLRPLRMFPTFGRRLFCQPQAAQQRAATRLHRDTLYWLADKKKGAVFRDDESGARTYPCVHACVCPSAGKPYFKITTPVRLAPLRTGISSARCSGRRNQSRPKIGLKIKSEQKPVAYVDSGRHQTPSLWIGMVKIDPPTALGSIGWGMALELGASVFGVHGFGN